MEIFELTTRPPETLFFSRNDLNDIRLGEIVLHELKDYEQAEIVILGCPQDDGVIHNRGRSGAAAAPDEIRRAFYKLSNFGISAKIFDLGNTIIQSNLEETHEVQTEIVRQLILDNKKIVSLGGGNDISYPDARALSEVAGAANVLAFNIDQHFDVRIDLPHNSGTPYRQLLDGNWILPRNFYEIGWQEHSNSPIYYQYLNKLGVNLVKLTDTQRFLDEKLDSLFSANCSLFWGFDADSVQASAAPGVSAPSPIGLTVEEFCRLASIAGNQSQTRIIEFTEVNPNFDIDGRTARLVAIAMHKFCARGGIK
jgi:formimidoylglutamase